MSVDPKLSTSESPYSAMGCNPILFTDVLGDKIIPKKASKEQIKRSDDVIEILESWNSPTINSILKEAKGKYTKIYINFLPDLRPVKGKSKSNVGRPNTLEKEWNKETAAGITLKSPKKGDKEADVIFGNESTSGVRDDEGVINRFDLTPLVFIDEFNHAINAKHDDAVNEHYDLYGKLLKEIEEGTLKVSETIESTIKERFDKAKEEKEKGVNDGQKK